jgi:hypothetical protein
MVARLAIGDGIKDGTSKTEGDTNTDEIFFSNYTYCYYIIYDICLIHAD